MLAITPIHNLLRLQDNDHRSRRLNRGLIAKIDPRRQRLYRKAQLPILLRGVQGLHPHHNKALSTVQQVRRLI